MLRSVLFIQKLRTWWNFHHKLNSINTYWNCYLHVHESQNNFLFNDFQCQLLRKVSFVAYLLKKSIIFVDIVYVYTEVQFYKSWIHPSSKIETRSVDMNTCYCLKHQLTTRRVPAYNIHFTLVCVCECVGSLLGYFLSLNINNEGTRWFNLLRKLHPNFLRSCYTPFAFATLKNEIRIGRGREEITTNIWIYLRTISRSISFLSARKRVLCGKGVIVQFVSLHWLKLLVNNGSNHWVPYIFLSCCRSFRLNEKYSK